MTLWIIVTVLCCAASVFLAIRLTRRFDRRPTAAAPVAAAGHGASPRGLLWRRAALVCLIGFLAVGGVGYYSSAFKRGPEPSRTAMTSGNVEPAGTDKGVGDVDSQIASLAARMKQSPNDVEGWRMLGWSYFNTQRYGESAEAYAKAAALKPDSNDLQSSYAEAMVQASGGVVTPASRKIFETVLGRDPTELRSRFYIALAREQAGDLNQALAMWTALIADAPAGAGWVPDVKVRIDGITARTAGKPTGNSTSGRSLATENQPGLDGKDHQSATDGMIATLAARLEKNPRDRDGWVMMIRSRSVMGDLTGARDALSRARTVFADDPPTLAQIEAISSSLGVTSGQAGNLLPEDIAAVTTLPEQDQKAMIRGMVEGLADRLAASPHDSEGWIRLIRSRVVLNERDLARQALRTALAEFKGDAAATMKISEAARGLGLMFD